MRPEEINHCPACSSKETDHGWKNGFFYLSCDYCGTVLMTCTSFGFLREWKEIRNGRTR